MKKIYLMLGVLFLVVSFSILRAEYADFNDDFTAAAQMKGKEAAQGTDYLIRNTTEVLHKENTAILAEIQKLHKEISDLKKEIKEVKDIVEGER